MAHHNSTGNEGELLARHFFEQKGYRLLHTNWRHRHWEVDLIAHKEDTLHFIEVKTRRTQKFGRPEESVTRKKLQNLIQAAEEYLHQYPQWKRIQFDVLAITLLKNKAPDFFLLEDVYV